MISSGFLGVMDLLLIIMLSALNIRYAEYVCLYCDNLPAYLTFAADVCLLSLSQIVSLQPLLLDHTYLRLSIIVLFFVLVVRSALSS